MRVFIGSYFEVENKFDSRERHIRQVANANQAQYWMTQGRSLEINVVKQSSWTIFWRFEVGPYTRGAPYNGSQYTPAPGFTISRPGAY